MNSKFKVIAGLIVLIASAGIFYVGSQFVQQDQSLDDSNALFGGEIERGYPSAGYLISREPGGNTKTCGYAVLNDSVAITASHCVDNSEAIFIGSGEYTANVNRAIEVNSATQKEGWINEQDRTQDFAVLAYTNQNNFFQNFAEIASPREGCVMRVVAYGRTEDPSENFVKPRKSAMVCASDIRDDIFFIEGINGESGICFGDSGSPIFFEGTNKVVGLVASIVLQDPTSTDPCAFGNKAIVVRADSNQSTVNNVIADLSSTGQVANSVGVASDFTINIERDTFLSRIGLRFIEDADQSELILYGAIGLGSITMLAAIFILLSGGKESSNSDGYYN